MGALHVGHRRLIEEARAATDFVVVSIFVNPTQFGPNEDYGKYPRTLAADLALAAEGGAAVAFVPEVAEVYPTGAISSFVEVPSLDSILEGASRPGHFRGVATVVLKLLNMVGPDVAFFGAKDYQQQLVIRRMAIDLDLPAEIRTVPTVREADGLAMSSRNRYLDADERRAARVLSVALNSAIAAVDGGERDPRPGSTDSPTNDRIRAEGDARLRGRGRRRHLASHPPVGPGIRSVALLAARVGPARLIDNATLPG